MRKILPNRRQSVRHKHVVKGRNLYVTIGFYADGTPGEVFVDIAKEGSEMNLLLDAFAITISLALQNGMQVKDLQDAYKGMCDDDLPKIIVDTLATTTLDD